jgi:hypothetical protein
MLAARRLTRRRSKGRRPRATKLDTFGRSAVPHRHCVPTCVAQSVPWRTGRPGIVGDRPRRVDRSIASKPTGRGGPFAAPSERRLSLGGRRWLEDGGRPGAGPMSTSIWLKTGGRNASNQRTLPKGGLVEGARSIAGRIAARGATQCDFPSCATE